MIGSLTGTILTSNRNPLLIGVNGVGYSVSVPPGYLSRLSRDSVQTIYTYTHVRDDALELFGMPSLDDLDVFLLLLSVSGIGPKTALLVIDRGKNAITRAVNMGDVDFFSGIPRLGKKNSQKIIIELKSKLGSLQDLDLSGDGAGETGELIEALLTMGFARTEILKILPKIDHAATAIEQQMKSALRLLGSRK